MSNSKEKLRNIFNLALIHRYEIKDKTISKKIILSEDLKRLIKNGVANNFEDCRLGYNLNYYNEYFIGSKINLKFQKCEFHPDILLIGKKFEDFPTAEDVFLHVTESSILKVPAIYKAGGFLKSGEPSKTKDD